MKMHPRSGQEATKPGTGTSPEPEKREPSLRALFPGASEVQLNEIEQTLHAYCAIVWRIYERLEREQPGTIDGLVRNSRIKEKVDS